MLVWLVDQGYSDNNVSTHVGAGYALPVDVRPNSLTYPDGTSPSNRREPFDATFGLDTVDSICLHKEVAVKAKGPRPSRPLRRATPQPTAWRSRRSTTPTDAYYSTAAPQNSVKVANEGVKATVVSEAGGFLTVDVTNPHSR